MKIALYTLGCKVNQYETQAMEQELLRRGHTLVPFEEAADAYIINTCTVTAVSDKKSRNAIRRAKKRNENAVVGVCGCYAQVAPEELHALGIDVLSGSGNRMGFLDLLEQEFAQRRPVVAVDDAMARRVFEPLPAGGLASRTRAMLKVEDGCVNFCSYCIIPYARGRVRSLSIEEAVAESLRLAREGYREIVLTGIEISSWGRDLKTGQTLTDLVEAVCRAVPEVRIRLGSLEPRTVTEEFCIRLAALPNVCPQFHLSLQSGCDETLRRMNRRYTTEEYYEKCQLLRKYFDNPALTTDVIVGFPQESEEEFERSMAFVDKVDFYETHIFKYSRREGTKAADMEGQVPEQVKNARSAQLIALGRRKRQAYEDRLIGKCVEVLMEEAVEREDGIYQVGHTKEYVKVGQKTTENLANQLINVEIENRLQIIH